MLVLRPSPMGAWDLLNRQIDAIVRDSLRPDLRLEPRWPKVDIVEQETAVVLTAEVPGLTQSDVDVTVHDGVLTLKGTRKTEESREGADIVRRERRHLTFERSFRLGFDVDTDAIEARLEHGLLTVHLPKVASVQPRRITIKGA